MLSSKHVHVAKQIFGSCSLKVNKSNSKILFLTEGTEYVRDLTNDLNCLPLQYVLLPFVSLVSGEIQQRLCKAECIVALNVFVWYRR